MRPIHQKIISVLCTAILLAGCVPQAFDLSWSAGTRSHPWTLADLRQLQIPKGLAPEDSMVAFYIRAVHTDLQIRIDWLQPKENTRHDLLLALDTQPGGTSRLPGGGQADISWDQLVVLPAEGSPQVLFQDLRPDPDLIPRMIWDPDNGITTIALNRGKIIGNPDQVAVQVILRDAGTGKTLDQPAAFRADGTHPNPAPLLLEFWDSLPALTPAQALRRWDGAHAGPYNARHGLHELLTAAENYHTPIFLLDLKEPSSLSAVDYMGGMRQVKRMAQSGLLVLPDTSFGDPHSAQVSIQASRMVGEHFGVGTSLIASIPLITSNAYHYPYRLANLKDTTHLVRSGNQVLIPLPAQSTDSSNTLAITSPGLPLSTREALIQTALSPDPTDIVVLGGSIPTSPWADSRAANVAFSYIGAHPWIQPLNLSSIQTLSAVKIETQPKSNCEQPGCEADPIDPPFSAVSPEQVAVFNNLISAPKNSATDLAWQSYWMLTAPAGDPNFKALADGYLPQVADLLAVSRWAANPYSESRCGVQIPGDPQPVCILASNQLFLILRPAGARLEFAFHRNSGRVDELVGTTSQFVIGLSDPSEWKPGLGMAGDPQVVPGGFVDTGHEYDPYRTSVRDGTISFENSSSGIEKIYQITGEQINVHYDLHNPGDVLLPIAVSPEARFTSGWSSQVLKDKPSDDEALLGFQGSGALMIHSNTPMNITSYFDSMRFMGTLENPDQDYPPGHFLPFPVSMIHIQADTSFDITLQPVQAQ